MYFFELGGKDINGKFMILIIIESGNLYKNVFLSWLDFILVNRDCRYVFVYLVRRFLVDINVLSEIFF